MLLNVPCDLSHYHSLKLYMVYVKRDCKSSVSFFRFFVCVLCYIYPLFKCECKNVLYSRD